MKWQQLLIFEVSNGCNFSAQHAERCPIADKSRWDLIQREKPVTDEMIIESAVMAYKEMGFRGMIAWHYYNEPTLEFGRMLYHMEEIRKQVPDQAAFYLFTNAELLETFAIDDLKKINRIWISNYSRKDYTWLKEQHPGVVVVAALLDSRYGMKKVNAVKPCLRPFTEVIIDYWGTFHLCCMDWRNEAGLPNIWDVGFRKGVEAFMRYRDALCRIPYPEFIMERCHTCSGALNRPCPVLTDVQCAAMRWVKQTYE